MEENNRTLTKEYLIKLTTQVGSTPLGRDLNLLKMIELFTINNLIIYLILIKIEVLLSNISNLLQVFQ